MPDFAILRTEKLKTAAAIRGAVSHNARTRETPNADPDGQIYTMVDSGIDPYGTVMARIELAGAKHRANSVLAQEVLLTASPEYFQPKTAENTDQENRGNKESLVMDWLELAQNWLRGEFGDRIVSAYLHMDEATPHIHAIVVPLTEDNRLSARDVFSKKSLVGMQTSYAESLESLGIIRGLQGSKATHIPIQKFYAAATKPFPEKLTKKDLEKVIFKAKASEIHRQKAKEYQQTAEKMRSESSRIRALPLSYVINFFGGLKRDPADKNQFIGDGFRISTNKSKWYDHVAQKGGGGAIDLAIHLTGSNFRNVISWLGEGIEPDDLMAESLHHAKEKTIEAKKNPIKSAIPEVNSNSLEKVRSYLIEERKIKPIMVDWLIKNNYLYADNRANVVFCYGEDDKRGEGVEIRGTFNAPDKKPFKGFRGKKSYFVLPTKRSQKMDSIAVTEGVIDALSYRQLNPGSLVFAVAGGVSDSILQAIVDKAVADGLSITAAFDNDAAGDSYANRLTVLAQVSDVEIYYDHPVFGKDWNEHLVNSLESNFNPYDHIEPEPELNHDERLKTDDTGDLTEMPIQTY